MSDAVINVMLRGLALPFACALVACAVVMGLASIPMRRMPADAHWSEVARKFWVLRLARVYALLWIMIIACAMFHRWGQPTWWGLLPGVAAFAGCTLGSRLAIRGLRLPEAVKRWTFSALVAQVLLYPGALITFVVMLLTWRRGLGLETWIIAGAMGLLGVWLIIGGSVFLLRTLGLLRPIADEEVEAMLREQGGRQGILPRHLMEVDLPLANAFAFAWTRDIAFTSEALKVLDRAEVRSIAAHELGHLMEKNAIRWISLAGLPTAVLVGLLPAAILSEKPWAVIGLFVIHIAVSRTLLRMRRKLETNADDHGRAGEEEAGVYARALEKIHEASLIPAVLHANMTHPSLYDRMLAGGVTPDFPRPAAPQRVAPVLLGAIAALGFWAAISGMGNWIETVVLFSSSG